ncbi:MAG: sulfite exporter TauE/SafE family protein [Afipia sp.]|nr:sulfite exporter TauE/SafE family protein [Afipia sp.]
MTEFIVPGAAAFFAGMLNTIAGGGTFLTFPALVNSGVPVGAANATSAVAVFPGYLGGALGFGPKISAFDRKRLLKIIAPTSISGLSGSVLLLVSSNEAFSVVVPFLLVLPTLAFALGDRLRDLAQRHNFGKADGALGTIAVAIYGGYFNRGLGIVLLARGMRDLNVMNGLKNALSFVLSAISVATFAAARIVVWPQAVLMIVAATAGGYAGAPVARASPRSVVRAVVVRVGAIMSAVFFWRVFG